MVDVKKRTKTDRLFNPGRFVGIFAVACISTWLVGHLDIDMGHSAKLHKRVVGPPPSHLCCPLIVCVEKDRFLVDNPTKISHSIGAICSVGQETRRPEIQGQSEVWHKGHAGRPCVGRCRLCDIVIGRSEKGSGGGSEAASGMIMLDSLRNAHPPDGQVPSLHLSPKCSDQSSSKASHRA